MHRNIGLRLLLTALTMKRKVLEAQIIYDMNMQFIYDETESIIPIDANGSDLPALDNRELSGVHLGCRACVSEGDMQSKASNKMSICSFRKGTSDWGVTGHRPIEFNNCLCHKQYHAYQL